MLIREQEISTCSSAWIERSTPNAKVRGSNPRRCVRTCEFKNDNVFVNSQARLAADTEFMIPFTHS